MSTETMYWPSGADSVDFNELEGKFVVSVEQLKCEDNDALLFKTADGETYLMTHRQDCCEGVYLDDVIGSWDDIVGQKIASAVCTFQDSPDASESGTWSFYSLVTFKGCVTLRWNGESNGYYSEEAGFYKVSHDRY